MGPLGIGLKSDQRIYRCRACLTRKSIRTESFLLECHQSLQEFVRVIFYYFVKGFEQELCHRELTENVEDGEGGAIIKLQTIYFLYAFARDRISRFMTASVAAKKFGGPGQVVLVDFFKLHLRE